MTDDWRALNRANWDERVPLHRAVSYGPAEGRLNAIEESELGPVTGLRVLHLQCHFGRDSLVLAGRGADVTGLDFSAPAVEAARSDAAALGLPARFVQADMYDAASAAGTGYDLVFTTWGTVCWLPDIEAWAQVVAACLRPGGRLYFADMHPAAHVFDDAAAGPDGRPGWLIPYFGSEPTVFENTADYADPGARLRNARTIEVLHPLSGIVGALLRAGLRLDWLHEHPRLTWKAFECLVPDQDGCWTWPDRPWLPLALSLGATLTPG